MKGLFVLFAIFTIGACQQFQCPHEYGFYPHETQCDKYWACDAGVATPKLCANGLAFANTDPDHLTENCDYLHNVACGRRTQLEPPISSLNCPRLYGIFAGEGDCKTFYTCWDGAANRYECPPGLGYDREKRVCMWADKVKECVAEEIGNGFVCPANDPLFRGTFTRHPHPEDCRLYYVCISGVAREYGCPIGTVFQIGADDQSGQCAKPKFVPGCEDYYGGLTAVNLHKDNLFNEAPNKVKKVRKTKVQAKKELSEDYYGDLDIKALMKLGFKKQTLNQSTAPIMPNTHSQTSQSDVEKMQTNQSEFRNSQNPSICDSPSELDNSLKQ